MFLLAFLSPYLLLLLPLILLLRPYLRNRSLRHVPGPPLARLSSWWLLYQARRGRRYLAVDAAHSKYGPLVRIQPDHVSIADLDALPIVYAHSGGWTKRSVDCCHSTAPHVRPSKSLTDPYLRQQLLYSICLHRSQPLQHPQSSRAHPQTQGRLPHLQRQVHRPVRAVHRQQLEGARQAVALPLRQGHTGRRALCRH